MHFRRRCAGRGTTHSEDCPRRQPVAGSTREHGRHANRPRLHHLRCQRRSPEPPAGVEEPGRVFSCRAVSARLEGGAQHGGDSVRGRHAAVGHRYRGDRRHLRVVAALDLRRHVSADGLRAGRRLAAGRCGYRCRADRGAVWRHTGGGAAGRESVLPGHHHQLRLIGLGAVRRCQDRRAVSPVERMATGRSLPAGGQPGRSGRYAADDRWARRPRGLGQDGQQPRVPAHDPGGGGVLLGYGRVAWRRRHRHRPDRHHVPRHRGLHDDRRAGGRRAWPDDRPGVSDIRWWWPGWHPARRDPGLHTGARERRSH